MEDSSSGYSNSHSRSLSSDVQSSVLSRLATIESMLGIGQYSQERSVVADVDELDVDDSLNGLWEATANLKRFTNPKYTKMWSRSVVRQLWDS